MFIFFFFCTGYTLFQNRGAAPLEDTLTTAYRKEIVLSIPGQAVNLHVSIVRIQGVKPSCFHCPDAGSQIFMFPLSGYRESDLHVSIVRMQGVQVLKCLKRAAFAGFLFRNEQTSSEKAQDGGNRLPLKEQSRAGADCFFKKP